jgi:hypothetical protein
VVTVTQDQGVVLVMAVRCRVTCPMSTTAAGGSGGGASAAAAPALRCFGGLCSKVRLIPIHSDQGSKVLLLLLDG